MKLGVLSDTHGLLRQEVLDHLQGIDAILHGGDINNQGIIDTLRSIAPVYVVRGNNDKEWADHLPLTLSFTLGGANIFMTHKKKDLPLDLNPYDLVVFGHSHRYEETYVGKTAVINPGSCGPRRFNQAITMATVEIIDGQIKITHIDIENRPKQRVLPDMKSIVETVMRETAKGRTVPEIAGKRGWDVDLVEQITRLYVTHPGVDADGILGKMGI